MPGEVLWFSSLAHASSRASSRSPAGRLWVGSSIDPGDGLVASQPTKKIEPERACSSLTFVSQMQSTESRASEDSVPERKFGARADKSEKSGRQRVLRRSLLFSSKLRLV